MDSDHRLHAFVAPAAVLLRLAGHDRAAVRGAERFEAAGRPRNGAHREVPPAVRGYKRAAVDNAAIAERPRRDDGERAGEASRRRRRRPDERLAFCAERGRARKAHNPNAGAKSKLWGRTRVVNPSVRPAVIAPRNGRPLQFPREEPAGGEIPKAARARSLTAPNTRLTRARPPRERPPRAPGLGSSRGGPGGAPRARITRRSPRLRKGRARRFDHARRCGK